ncbi:hypothetical protein AAE478_007296 [Parahypoxylon ruwenzoriense]
MSYYESRNPPPLPARSPRPGGNATPSSAGYPNWNCPPPPRSPPELPVLNTQSEPIPPPIPRRPVGYGIRQPPLGFPLLPSPPGPPLGPPLGISLHTPIEPQPNTPWSGSGYGYSPNPLPGPGAQNPSISTVPSPLEDLQNEPVRYARSMVESLPSPSAVSSCLDTPVNFATDWYYHSDVPEFLICSRCYVDNICRTKFRDSFKSQRSTDEKPRICRFSKPQMQEHLFRTAVATG